MVFSMPHHSKLILPNPLTICSTLVPMLSRFNWFSRSPTIRSTSHQSHRTMAQHGCVFCPDSTDFHDAPPFGAHLTKATAPCFIMDAYFVPIQQFERLPLGTKP